MLFIAVGKSYENIKKSGHLPLCGTGSSLGYLSVGLHCCAAKRCLQQWRLAASLSFSRHPPSPLARGKN